MRYRFFAGLVGGFGTLVAAGFSQAAVVDFNDWNKVDLANNANSVWEVSNGGATAMQMENAYPSTLLSSEAYLNSRMTGTFSVDTSSDDDFIGFIIGWQSETDYYLLDWKQREQNGSLGLAEQAITLSHITGETSAADLWSHSGDNVTVLMSAYSAWEDYRKYDVTIEYTDTFFSIALDGFPPLFQKTWAFSAGRFGLYSMSQPRALFENFDISPTAPVPEPATMLLFGAGLTGLVSMQYRRRKQSS